jgi:toluene monooxygenase system protein E
VATFYDLKQRQSPLQLDDWEAFSDPLETTYASYVARQQARDTFVDGLFRAMEATGYDARLSPRWLRFLEVLLPTLRYPGHALMMVAAYVGQMAPTSRVLIAATFQSADETRRIETVCRRIAQIRATHPHFAPAAEQQWESASAWQPLRKLMEELLVCYDFGEALIALNVAVKPLFDRYFVDEVARIAPMEGDPMLAQLLFSLGEDCEWHRNWTRSLVALAAARPNGRARIGKWAAEWLERTTLALLELEAAWRALELEHVPNLSRAESEVRKEVVSMELIEGGSE